MSEDIVTRTTCVVSSLINWSSAIVDFSDIIIHLSIIWVFAQNYVTDHLSVSILHYQVPYGATVSQNTLLDFRLNICFLISSQAFFPPCLKITRRISKFYSRVGRAFWKQE